VRPGLPIWVADLIRKRHLQSRVEAGAFCFVQPCFIGVGCARKQRKDDQGSHAVFLAFDAGFSRVIINSHTHWRHHFCGVSFEGST
jgi:hypothetical protein